MKNDKDFWTFALLAIIGCITFLGALENENFHRETMAHLDAIQAEQRAGFSALAAVPPSSHGKVEMKWMGEGITRAYVATHVFCSNLDAWVERKNFSANDTADLAGSAGLKWDDCKGDWVSTTKGQRQ